MQAPHGPYRIARNGQVVLGKDVLGSVGLEPGDAVYLIPNDSHDGTILVVPVELAVTWFEAGRAQGETALEQARKDP